MRGEWHIAWLLPTNGIGNSMADNAWLGRGYLSYPLTAFLMPALIGSWRFTLFSYLAGPFLAGLTTSNINEWPAVWCLFSTCIIALLVNTRLRGYIHVRKWFTWKYLLARGPSRVVNAE